jgi:hypothetical protein
VQGLSSRGRRGRRRLRGSIFFCLIALVLAIGLAKLFGPLGTIRALSDRMAQLEMKKAALVFEQGQLDEYKQYAATEDGREAAARRLGYVRPGERRIVFSREKAGEDAAAEEPGATPGS